MLFSFKDAGAHRRGMLLHAMDAGISAGTEVLTLSAPKCSTRLQADSFCISAQLPAVKRLAFIDFLVKNFRMPFKPLDPARNAPYLF